MTATNGTNNSTALTFSTDNLGTLAEGMRIDNAGNVGIGTVSPGAKLEVAGQVKITGGTPGVAGKVLTSDASGLATWTIPAATGVTSLTAGTGLTGRGTITTTGTIAADTTYLQRRVSGTCTAGNSIQTVAADGHRHVRPQAPVRSQA